MSYLRAANADFSASTAASPRSVETLITEVPPGVNMGFEPSFTIGLGN